MMVMAVLLRSLVAMFLLVNPVLLWAASLDGTWKYERAADYYGRAGLDRLNHFDTVTIKGGEIKFTQGCTVQFEPEDYFFSEVFQPFAKGNVTEKQVDSFLSKKFGLTLSKTKIVYSLAGATNCSERVMEFFQIDDRIIVPIGATFYSYVKTAHEDSAAFASPTTLPLVAGYKISRLPTDFDRYLSACRLKILDARGHPRTTEKCAPDFFPYVADPKRNDTLMNIIGNHDYAANGQRYTEGFSPPFKQKVPATFLVFPPKGRVALIRVDDFDIVKNEERDVMSGVYLSIVNGKVVDQIYGCHFDMNYVCMLEGTPIAKLLDSGKIERLAPQ